MPTRFLFLALAVLAGADHAAAQPACGSAERGQLACMAGRACVCRYEPGGSLTGIPGGWAWDCGALRPDCAPPPPAPPPPGPAIGADVYVLPPAWQGGDGGDTQPPRPQPRWQSR